MIGTNKPSAAIKSLYILFLVMMFSGLKAQQSNTLFFMHFLPESNFINPAIQNECRLFIGLPVISSLHAHISNSGFTAGQLLQKNSGGGYSIRADNVLSKLGTRNLMTAELYTTILAIGLQRDNYYYTFTIRIKAIWRLPIHRIWWLLPWKGIPGLKDNGSIPGERAFF